MSSQITNLLRLRREAPGDDDITPRLAELLYPELKRVAGALMRRERLGHTLQPTAVVHEAFVRLVNQNDASWQDRAHFLGIATRVMRQVLVDHARRRRSAKRGGPAARVTLDEQLVATSGPSIDVLALDQALSRYAALDPRGARVAELRIFGGLTVREAAEALAVSPRTVDGDWSVARMWLARELTHS